MIVLGSFPEHLETANRLGAKALTSGARIWNYLGENGEQWNMVRTYLDTSLRIHQEFALATNPAAIPSSSMTMMELNHLCAHGYHFNQSGTPITIRRQGQEAGSPPPMPVWDFALSAIRSHFPSFALRTKLQKALRPGGADVQLEEAIREQMSFLFDRFEGSVVSNKYFPRAFGNAIVVFRTSTLFLRVVRDRDELRLDVASVDKSSDWIDSAFALAAVTSASGETPFTLHRSIQTIARNLEPRFADLQNAFSEKEEPTTRQKISEICRRENILAIEKLNSFASTPSSHTFT